MRKIRIFALPSHQTAERTSGVDFARIIQPVKALHGYKDEDTEFSVDLFDIHAKHQVDWLNISKQYDIIYLNYINNPWGFAAMGAMARKNGVKIVLDLDDALWNIRSDNPAYDVYKKGSEAISNFNAICKEVDWMTTTNSYLKHVIMNNTTKKADRIAIFPNYVDLTLYSHISPFKNTGQIRLLHFGSTTHFIDLNDKEFLDGVGKIMAEYPNVTFKSVGAFIPALRERWGQRYEQAYGDPDIYTWIKGKFRDYLDETDILLTPLTVDIYNKSKSSIKFVESASTKTPGVWQRIRQYEEVIEDGKNGYIAGKANEWYNAIKTLIDNPDKRKQMGEEAYNTVKEGWQIQDHVKDYAQFLKKVLDE